MKRSISHEFFFIFQAALMLPVLLFTAIRSQSQSAVASQWQRVGMGGGGAMFHPAVSPFNVNEVILACDMTCSFRTSNGGQSWDEFNLHGPVSYFVYDPVDSNVVYAQSIGLFKSTDKGRTWNLLFPNPAEVTEIVRKGDHAEEVIVTADSSSKRVVALAVDPTDSKKLYAAIQVNRDETNFCTSTDGGLTWKNERRLTDGAKNIFLDPSSSSGSRTVYVTGKKTISVKKNGVWKINGGPEGVKTITTYTGGYNKKDNKYVIYSISGKSYFNPENEKSGIYYSDNGGETWENRQQGILKFQMAGTELPEWRTIATSALHPEVVYVSYKELRTSSDAVCLGVAKSMDYGKTWELKWKDAENKRDDKNSTSDDWLSYTFGAGWSENPFSLGISDKDPNICYGTDFGRTMKTTDGGTKWVAVNSKKQSGNSWSTRGLDVTCNYSVVMDPFDSTHFFIPYTDIGLMESHDGGISWKSATEKNGVPKKWQNSTYWLAFDPEIKGRAWAVMSPVHDLPRPKMWRAKGTGDFRGGIMMTDDAAKTWKIVSDTTDEAAFTHILIDPQSDKNKRTLYACAFGKGVYKSTDGGKSWTRKNKGIESEGPLAWRITRREKDGALFLIVNRRSDDTSIGNVNTDGAIYMSVDGAENWQKIKLPPGTNGPTSISLNESDSNRWLISAWGKLNAGRFTTDSGGGIFVSADAGKSWKQVLASDQHIHDLTYDPRTKRFYACGFEGAAYYSSDDGATWKHINGYNFKWGRRVVPDPLDPEKIYVLTFGGGVWHGPATGDANAVDNVVTPVFQFH